MKKSRFVEREHGAAIVEFAIVLPILLLLVFGIIDLSRALFVKNNLTSAVREGARKAAVMANPIKDSIDAVVLRYASASGVFGGDSVTAAMTSVSYSPNPPPNTSYITVQINNYPLVWITPIPKLVGFGDTLQISTTAVFRWESGT